jgi:site-specific DNA recombinase
MGLHPPLITEDIFHLANDVLEGRKRNMKFHDDKSELYPLKGFLKCPVHNTSLTAYACRSHNKALHHYYLCCKSKCKQRHRIKDVHDSIEEILSTISFSAQTVNLYRKMLEKIFEKEDLNRKDEIQIVNKDIEKAEARRSNLQDLILDGTITPQDYQDMKEKVDKDLVLSKSKLSGLMDQPSPYKTYISKTVPMLENLTGFYREADGQTKRKILGCIFSEKLILEKGRVATTPFTEPIQVLFKITKGLQGFKNKEEVENNLLSTLAPQVRLELTTHGLTVRCSNQLSY